MTRYSLIPASYVYLVRDGAVLLQLRQNTGYMDGYWAAGAAGHVEVGETSADAAARELREELGLSVDLDDLLPSSVMHRTDGSDTPREQRVEWFFSCSTWGGEPAILEPRKCAELRWFPLDDLPEKVPDYERVALDWLRDGVGIGLLNVGFTPRSWE
ncbi:MAG: NUDIX domain-containing protein [Tessaracoccus sp.]|uniref:NUDIX hydrolase n=1 Tax=Tessaracoccus sp. TaxID=1971211 RepID=UPI001EBA88E8|nr:NUDIX domain-containing protein [Tessaracoccus sp.]MBK7821321.1 NUDIX domain-containing protein [Tessaracoccus sp.]